MQIIDQAEPLVGIQWETAQIQEIDNVQVGATAPSIKKEAKVGGPIRMGSELGPLAMSYVEEKGWIAEPLGPSSKHWKRLAREVKAKPDSKGKSPIKAKRKGPTSLQNLDANIKDLKRRKCKKVDMHKTVEKSNMVGEVAVATVQHRRAQ